MRGDIVDPHRLKRACAYVQRDLSGLDAFLGELAEQCVVEVQACSRCSHRAWHARVDRLIARAIGIVGCVRDVGRQGHLTMRLQQREHVLIVLQAKVEQIVGALDHGSLNRVRQLDARTRSWAVAGAHVCEKLALAEDAFDQQLDPSAGLLGTEQPGLDHARVVEDEQIAGRQQVGHVGDHSVDERFPAQAQQPARRAGG